MAMKNNPCTRISVVSLCFLLLSPLYHGDDTITANKPLYGNQTLVSATGIFELGFFQPGNSSNSYVGMWYKQVSKKTILWVANKDNPIFDYSASELKIINGNLVLTNKSKTAIWSTNLDYIASDSSVKAILQDDGNLVLRGERNSTLWQSFDHPTHTWLPGGKIGFNKRTRKNLSLSSWKSTEDPATGLFSLELVPIGIVQFLLLWNRTQHYWTSGTWDPVHHFFSLVPEMRRYTCEMSYVDNENESYFTFSQRDPSTITIFTLNVFGQMQDSTWLFDRQEWKLWSSYPGQNCQIYACCGAFGYCNENSLPFCNCLDGFEPASASDWEFKGYSSGCVRRSQLKCENHVASTSRDKFWVYSNMGFPDHAQSLTAESLEECEAACLNNCSCTAYAYDTARCSIWIGDLLNLKQLSEVDTRRSDLYVKLAASEFSSISNKKMIIAIVAGGLALGIMAVLCILFGAWELRTRKISAIKMTDGSTLMVFGYKDLQKATKNFSNRLGGGGFGSVFIGTLPDSSAIAIKKLESISQGDKQFRTEVRTIGIIQHVNLVRLRGFCSEGMRKLLVYDYMPNGSLDKHLFCGAAYSTVLDWKIRYQIALGVARGLAYLHEKCRECIIHCDIKPENILLDAKFYPKVADFGLAKIIGREFSRILTTMRGTIGYLAPEWISGEAITPKVDVYSYGMMLFELVSGRRNTEQSFGDGKLRFFPTFVAKKASEGGDIFSILDSRLDGKADGEELMKICYVACWCIQDEESCRLSMGQVVLILEGVLDVSVPPVPRSFLLLVDDTDDEQLDFFTRSS